MTERARHPYLYKPGEYGIPLDPSVRGIITSGSGRKLSIYHDHANVRILDEADSRLYMYGYILDHGVDGGRFGFNLRTRWGTRKHPDMFAASFVRYAIEVFDEIGNMPSTIRALWFPYSDNYKQYRIKRVQGDVPTDAAKTTWTGTQVGKMGFTTIESVEELRDPKGGPFVKTVFSRGKTK